MPVRDKTLYTFAAVPGFEKISYKSLCSEQLRPPTTTKPRCKQCRGPCNSLCKAIAKLTFQLSKVCQH